MPDRVCAPVFAPPQTVGQRPISCQATVGLPGRSLDASGPPVPMTVPEPQDGNTFALEPGNPASIAAEGPATHHHLRFAQPRGLGQKVSDKFTVPLVGAS